LIPFNIYFNIFLASFSYKNLFYFKKKHKSGPLINITYPYNIQEQLQMNFHLFQLYHSLLLYFSDLNFNEFHFLLLHVLYNLF